MDSDPECVSDEEPQAGCDGVECWILPYGQAPPPHRRVNIPTEDDDGTTRTVVVAIRHMGYDPDKPPITMELRRSNDNSVIERFKRHEIIDTYRVQLAQANTYVALVAV